MTLRIVVSFVFIVGLNTSLFAATTSKSTPQTVGATQAEEFPCPAVLVERFFNNNDFFCTLIQTWKSKVDRLKAKSMLLDFTQSSFDCVAFDCVQHLQEKYYQLIAKIEALDPASCSLPPHERTHDHGTGDPSIILCNKIIQCIDRVINTAWSNDAVKIVAEFITHQLNLIVNYCNEMDYFSYTEDLDTLNNEICLLGAYDGKCHSATCRSLTTNIFDLKNCYLSKLIHENNELLKTISSVLSQSIFQNHQEQLAIISGGQALNADMISAMVALQQKIGTQLEVLDEFDKIYQIAQNLTNNAADSDDDYNYLAKRQRKI